MNSSIIKMFGPSISDPSKIVNRDVPACDELAYKAVGYKRGSVAEEPAPEVVEAPAVGSVEVAAQDVSGMNKSQLLEHAASLGVEADQSMTKAQIVAALEAAN